MRQKTVVLDGTGAVLIGQDATNATRLMSVLIPKNAGPATCTLTGFGKATASSGALTAKSIVLTGSTADDRFFDFGPIGWLADVGPLTAQASVDEIVVVTYKTEAEV